jgi:hypothetical protein
MKKTSLAAAALCFAVSAVGVPFAATAEPALLTATQLDQVSAGARLAGVEMPTINVAVGGVDLGNLNVTTQAATAVAVSTAACGVCDAAISDAAALATNAQQ